MTQEQRSPREAGYVRKLAGWAQRHSTLLRWVPMMLPLTYAAALVAYVLFGGAR